MHNINNKLQVLFLGSSEFNSSLKELKEFLKFNITISEDLSKDFPIEKYKVILIDYEIFDKLNISKTLNKLENNIKLFIVNSKNNEKISLSNKIQIPFTISDLNSKVLALISSKKFSKNSSIKIKEYLLDKNEKKLKKNKIFLILTEKEIQLLELLCDSSESVSKKTILDRVWNYSPDTDTHTVETHIYRLRKKIKDKFQDDNFIMSLKDGYKIEEKK